MEEEAALISHEIESEIIYLVEMYNSDLVRELFKASLELIRLRPVRRRPVRRRPLLRDIALARFIRRLTNYQRH